MPKCQRYEPDEDVTVEPEDQSANEAAEEPVRAELVHESANPSQ